MIESIKLEDHEQYSLRNTIKIITELKEKYPNLFSIAVKYNIVKDETVIKYLESILEYF